MVVERPTLLDSLALCLVVDGSWKWADVGIRPYADMMVAGNGRTHRSAPTSAIL